MQDKRINELTKLIATKLELDPAKLAPGDHLTEDHGIDSLEFIEVIAMLEREYQITIDEADVAGMTSVEEVYRVVAIQADW